MSTPVEVLCKVSCYIFKVTSTVMLCTLLKYICKLFLHCHERCVYCSSWCKIGKMNVYSYFQHNGSIYEQKDGTAMGSPVSVVIANLSVEV